MFKLQNEHESIEINKAGSVDGSGIIITCYDEHGNDVVTPFLNKKQVIQLRDYLNKVIESGHLDKVY